MTGLVFWVVTIALWAGITYVGYQLLRKMAPAFAASHSEETGAMIAVFVAALLLAVFTQ